MRQENMTLDDDKNQSKLTKKKTDDEVHRQVHKTIMLLHFICSKALKKD